MGSAGGALRRLQYGFSGRSIVRGFPLGFGCGEGRFQLGFGVGFPGLGAQAFGDLQAGDRLRVIAGELGWRAGLSQLRINSRSTRIEVWKDD